MCGDGKLRDKKQATRHAEGSSHISKKKSSPSHLREPGLHSGSLKLSDIPPPSTPSTSHILPHAPINPDYLQRTFLEDLANSHVSPSEPLQAGATPWEMAGDFSWDDDPAEIWLSAEEELKEKLSTLTSEYMLTAVQLEEDSDSEEVPEEEDEPDSGEVQFFDSIKID